MADGAANGLFRLITTGMLARLRRPKSRSISPRE